MKKKKCDIGEGRQNQHKYCTAVPPTTTRWQVTGSLLLWQQQQPFVSGAAGKPSVTVCFLILQAVVQVN